jgi:hypothetical protein
MHWLAKKDDKLYSVKLDIGMLGGRTTLVGEDTEIEPERAKYVRANVEKWEVEWLEQEAKKSRLAAIVAFRACFRSLEPLCRTA